ncbi:hypothetical protein T4B_1646 [Trichinella pseudospiralis]|uniref:Uncharacterized protein n=1 Tax=Trichinella pseudospiralis TaxID=6337 RepID=A0A0V1IJU6_TRIPS|nr:hypothetical protein T4A_1632 [Trichinella pseudospiralis]KRZ23062.1 hypothetical protein T4B_1646 [Trichinella pseudospiralis]
MEIVSHVCVTAQDKILSLTTLSTVVPPHLRDVGSDGTANVEFMRTLAALTYNPRPRCIIILLYKSLPEVDGLSGAYF